MSEPTTKAGRRFERENGTVHRGLILAIEAEARADALNVEALASILRREWDREAEQFFWASDPGPNDTNGWAVDMARAILAERQQDAATDEAEKEWAKPLPKDVP